jgi:hypothetical protein
LLNRRMVGYASNTTITPADALVATILRVMEWNRAYEALTLQALCPGTSMDALREALHALWIARRVERVGASGWRRQESQWDGRPREGVQPS